MGHFSVTLEAQSDLLPSPRGSEIVRGPRMVLSSILSQSRDVFNQSVDYLTQ